MKKSIHSAEYAVFLRRLRQTREQVGLTQEQLAHRLNVTQTFVSKCERGERRIDIIELRSFCSAFGITLLQFAESFEDAIWQRNHQSI